jgi:hypothetical protein
MTLRVIEVIQRALGFDTTETALLDDIFGGSDLHSIRCLLDDCCRSYENGQHRDGVMLEELDEGSWAGHCWNSTTAANLQRHGSTQLVANFSTCIRARNLGGYVHAEVAKDGQADDIIEVPVTGSENIRDNRDYIPSITEGHRWENTNVGVPDEIGRFSRQDVDHAAETGNIAILQAIVDS